MKEFLVYLHAELNRLLLLYKSSEKLSDDDVELRKYIHGTVLFLQEYALYSKDKMLYGIADDMEYAIRHMWVPFKAEDALKDVEENIRKYN